MGLLSLSVVAVVTVMVLLTLNGSNVVSCYFDVCCSNSAS